jgi:hypothetical protein
VYEIRRHVCGVSTVSALLVCVPGVAKHGVPERSRVAHLTDGTVADDHTWEELAGALGKDK